MRRPPAIALATTLLVAGGAHAQARPEHRAQFVEAATPINRGQALEGPTRQDDDGFGNLGLSYTIAGGALLPSTGDVRFDASGTQYRGSDIGVRHPLLGQFDVLRLDFLVARHLSLGVGIPFAFGGADGSGPQSRHFLGDLSSASLLANVSVVWQWQRVRLHVGVDLGGSGFWTTSADDSSVIASGAQWHVAPRVALEYVGDRTLLIGLYASTNAIDEPSFIVGGTMGFSTLAFGEGAR